MRRKILVLTAFEGTRTVFEVFRIPDPKNNNQWWLTGQDATGTTDAPPAAEAQKIDRIVFYEQPNNPDDAVANDAILELPFIRGSVWLRLEGNTAGDRKFVLEYALIRCFLSDHERWTPWPRSEAALFTATLAPSEPNNSNYTPLGFPAGEAIWHNDRNASKSYFLPLQRAELVNHFEFSFDFIIWQFELGRVFELSQFPQSGRWTARAFSLVGGKPLQIEFAIEVLNSQTYDFSHAGLPGLTLPATALRWRQQPYGLVEDWPTRAGGSFDPTWRVEMSLSQDPNPQQPDKTGEASKKLIEFYNTKIAEPVHLSLRRVREGQPLSLLPKLEIEPKGGSPVHNMKPHEWLVDLVVHGEWESLKPQPGGKAAKALDYPTDFKGDGRFRIEFGTLRPASLPPVDKHGQLSEITAPDGLLVAATFPGFSTTLCDKNGNPQALALPLLLHGLPPERSPNFGQMLEVEMVLSAARSKKPGGEDPFGQRVRLGALELAFGSEVADTRTAPQPVLSVKETAAFALRFSLRDDRSPVVSALEIYLPVMRVGAAGQDALPGEEFAEMFQSNPRDNKERNYEKQFAREPALVLEFLPSSPEKFPTDAPPYGLAITETVLSGESQTVDLRLSQPDGTAGPPPGATQRLWIIDRDPLMLAEVRFENFLEDLLSGTTNEIANFSTRTGAAWEVGAGARGFDLVLPPQGVGEAMEKNKGTEGGRPSDIDPGRIVDYRFTPPTVLRVQPSYYRQRFAEPPWNLRRLLGYPGQRDPGMQVGRIDFELLYGLAGSVVVDDLRLAEISARLGAVPGRQSRRPLWAASKSQLAAFEQHRLTWAQWYALLLGRLAVLEPWAHRQRDRDLALKEGVGYSLRRSARLKFPTPVLLDAHGNPDYPRLETLAPDVPKETYLPTQSPTGKKYAPGDPLPGGVAWPFESINLYNLLWATPEAESGELHRPYFSALGGWGFQKAVFAEGQLRIYADTAMGRTHSVTLEIFGRISVGWHLAKLVIIYERSVLPTRQFVYEKENTNPTAEEGEQDALRGRPVLRKVREYVEILEPLRRFPDNASAPVENGCVLGIEFPEGARRINLTSRWGEDVGVAHSPAEQAEGWKVPLWLRGARPEDVYPKPQIVALCAAAQTDGPVRVEIDEPEKLYFFTNTKQGRARDPHDWPAVQGVDFGFAPPEAAKPPKEPDAWKEGRPELGKNEKLDADAAVKGGLGPFTFALKQASHAIDVMAARNPQPTGAMLRNVTLMRGFVLRDTPLSAEQTQFLQTRDRVNAGIAATREWLGETREVLRKEGTDAAGKQVGAAGKLLEDLKKQVGELRETLVGANAPKIPEPKDLCPKLRKQVQQVLAPARVAGKALGDNFAQRALAIVDQVFDAGGAVTDARDALMKAGDEVLKRWKTELARLNPIQVEAQRARNLLLGAADDLAREAIGQLDNFDRELAALPGAWAAAAVVWESSLDPWREARALARSALTGIDDAVLQAVRPWVAALPHAFRFTLQPLTVAMEDALKALERFKGFDDLATAFEHESQQEYEAAVLKLRGEVAAAIAPLTGNWDALWKGGIAALDSILAEANKLHAALTMAAEKEWGEIKTPLGEAFADVTAPVVAVRDALRSRVATMQRTWDDALDRIDDQVGGSLDGLCTTFFGSAQDYIKYLNWLLGEDRIKDWINDALKLLPTGEELQQRLRALERELADAARGFVERASSALNDTLQEIMKPVTAAGDSVLRLVRAFGEAPRVPSLDFRLPDTDAAGLAHIGYYFQDLAKKIPLPHVDLTPVLAKANDLGKELVNALEIKLPTTQLFDRFQPFDLPNFDLRHIFPNFAGLKLDDLFEGLKLPSGANDNVKITHGEDPQSLSGWVQIDVNQRFAQTATLFSYAGIVMQVGGGEFHATSRIEGGANQSPRQSFQGRIFGDWAVTVGSFQLLEIERTALRFDDAGRITFDVSPEKVKLPGAMAWLADLISAFDFGNKGFSFKVSPQGVQVVLNLPLPDVQAGAFGMANLSLGFFFELAILPSFVITTGARVASREAPFTLTIFILGGAGWFDFRLRYVPRTGELVAMVSIAIMASASLAVSLGPVSGGVYAYFGIVVDYTARRGAAGHLAVAIVLRFCGRVSLLGIVTAYLEMGLLAQYESGGSLTGTGYVSVEIKICWCFTLSVSASISYTFGGSGGGGTKALAGGTAISHADAAAEYSEMFA